MTSALVSSLQRHASERPDVIAVREVGESGIGRSLSWDRLASAAAAVARRLKRKGAPRTVVISAGNRVEGLVAILGGMWAGAAVAPVAPELRAAEIRDLAEAIEADTLVADLDHLLAVDGLGLEGLELDSILALAPADGPVDGDGGSILLRSSGTTGAPKVVRRNAPALDAVGRACAKAIGIGASDTMLVAIPVYHSYGIDQAVLTAMIAGCAVELHARFDAGRVKAALVDREIHVYPAVPVMLDALARIARDPVRPRVLRRVFSAGSPLPARVARAFRAAFGIDVGQIYGATEFGSVAYNDPERVGFDAEAVGHPLDDVRFRILDSEKPRVDSELPAGKEGHVAVAAPSMLSEYVGDPVPPTQEGFLLTGDLGSVDGTGRLRLTGRIKLLVDVGGQKVNPLEVEAVLAQHPDVAEVVAVPIPYSDTASRLKAIVVPEVGCDPSREELRRYAREHLIHYKVPRSFEIRRDVPRSPTGKILRQSLMPAAETPGRSS